MIWYVLVRERYILGYTTYIHTSMCLFVLCKLTCTAYLILHVIIAVATSMWGASGGGTAPSQILPFLPHMDSMYSIISTRYRK